MIDLYQHELVYKTKIPKSESDIRIRTKSSVKL